MLYDLSFAQLLGMIETRNEREVRSHEEAERRAALREQGYEPAPRGTQDRVPTVSDVSKIFG